MSELKPKVKMKLFKNFYGEVSLHDQVQAIVSVTGASYADVMREVLKLGVEAYEADND